MARGNRDSRKSSARRSPSQSSRGRSRRGDGNPSNNGRGRGRADAAPQSFSDLREPGTRTARFRPDSRRAMGERWEAPNARYPVRRAGPGPSVGDPFNNAAHGASYNPVGGDYGRGERGVRGYQGGYQGSGYNGPMRQSYRTSFAQYGAGLPPDQMRSLGAGSIVGRPGQVPGQMVRHPQYGVQGGSRRPNYGNGYGVYGPDSMMGGGYAYPTYHGSTGPYGTQGGYSQIGSDIDRRIDSAPGTGYGGGMPSPNR